MITMYSRDGSLLSGESLANYGSQGTSSGRSALRYGPFYRTIPAFVRSSKNLKDLEDLIWDAKYGFAMSSVKMKGSISSIRGTWSPHSRG